MAPTVVLLKISVPGRINWPRGPDVVRESWFADPGVNRSLSCSSVSQRYEAFGALRNNYHEVCFVWIDHFSKSIVLFRRDFDILPGSIHLDLPLEAAAVTKEASEKDHSSQDNRIVSPCDGDGDGGCYAPTSAATSRIIYFNFYQKEKGDFCLWYQWRLLEFLL